MGSRLRLVASIREFTSLSRGVGADVAKGRIGRRRREVKIEWRVRMLVGSKRDGDSEGDNARHPHPPHFRS